MTDERLPSAVQKDGRQGFLGGAFLLALCTGCAAPEGFVFTAYEGTFWTIDNDSLADSQAATGELEGWLHRARVEFGMFEGIPPGRIPRIVIGRDAAPPETRGQLDRLGPDGFVIDASRGRLILAGNPPDGTCFAVYAFLERFVGARWLWPGAEGEVLRPAFSLRIPPVHIEEQPAYAWRDLGPGGALWGPLDKWTKERELGVTEAHQREAALWAKRNRFGGLRIHGGHAFGEVLPPAKYGASHPEYYALVKGRRDCSPEGFDGKHGRQPCTTNPDVIRLTVDYARSFFDAHADADGLSISLNDGRGFCECERCVALDVGGARTAADDPESGPGGAHRIITDRVITFANAVAEEVARTHPAKRLLFFAYENYAAPPARVKVHPNLIIQYTMHSASHWDAREDAKEFADVSRWSGAAENLAIYEYFVQGSWPEMPRLFPEVIARDVRRLYGLGFRHYQTQAGNGFAVNGLNYYVLGRLLWNTSAEPDAIVRDYVESGFGRAAPAVRRYFDRLAARWREAGAGVWMAAPTAEEYGRVAALYPPEWRAACRADLDAAWAAADGPERTRVEFLVKGWRYVELTMAAVERSLALTRAGWDLGRNVKAPAGADPAPARAALEAWEERDSYVEELKQEFVVPYLWVRYNNESRAFNPARRLARALAGGLR